MSAAALFLIALTLITCIGIFTWEVYGEDIKRWWVACRGARKREEA